MDNNNQENDNRITPDSVSAQQEQPAAPEAPTQPTEPVAPAAPVDPTPPAAPEAPVQPAVPQHPVTPPPSPAPSVTTTQNLGNVDNPNLQPSPAPQQPTTGAYIPQSMNANKVSREETYQEDMLQKAHTMRDILRAQPKVWAMVPLQPGEKPGTMLPVGINGYFIYIKKGVMVQVPQQIGEIVAASFNLDYENGAEIDLSKNEDKQRALA